MKGSTSLTVNLFVLTFIVLCLFPLQLALSCCPNTCPVNGGGCAQAMSCSSGNSCSTPSQCGQSSSTSSSGSDSYDYSNTGYTPTSDTIGAAIPGTMRIAVGGGIEGVTAEKLAYLKSLGVTEYHLVVTDLGAYKAQVDLIHQAGMTAVMDLEYPLWATKGFNTQLDFNQFRGQFQAAKDAGWDAFASEGLSGDQINVLRDYLPYINYGSDTGVDLYGSQYYHHSSDSANYLESYNTASWDSYLNALVSASKHTPNNMGLTLGLWTTSDISTNSATLTQFINQAKSMGVNIGTCLFWSGVGADPTSLIKSGGFENTIKALTTTFH
jgi:hypothetical protein